jgi:hypothetical protein
MQISAAMPSAVKIKRLNRIYSSMILVERLFSGDVQETNHTPTSDSAVIFCTLILESRDFVPTAPIVVQ